MELMTTAHLISWRSSSIFHPSVLFTMIPWNNCARRYTSG